MDLSHLSDEELTKLHKEESASVVDPNPETNDPNPETNDLESVARGAVEGIPMGGQIVSGLATLASSPLSELADPHKLGEAYAKNKATWDEAQAKARADDPYLFGGAEITADIAGFIALPGAATGAAGMAKMGSWIFAKEAGLHPENSIGSHLQAASVGVVAGEVGGQVLNKAAEVAAPYVKKLATNTIVQWATSGIPTLKNEIEQHANFFYNGAVKDSVTAIDDYLKDIATVKVNGVSILHPNATTESTVKAIDTAKKFLGNDMESLLSKNTDKVNIQELETTLLSKIKTSSEYPPLQASIDKAILEIKGTLRELEPVEVSKILPDGTTGKVTEMLPIKPKNLSYKALHQLKSDVN